VQTYKAGRFTAAHGTGTSNQRMVVCWAAVLVLVLQQGGSPNELDGLIWKQQTVLQKDRQY
jgi:hypothetical protein